MLKSLRSAGVVAILGIFLISTGVGCGGDGDGGNGGTSALQTQGMYSFDSVGQGGGIIGIIYLQIAQAQALVAGSEKLQTLQTLPCALGGTFTATNQDGIDPSALTDTLNLTYNDCDIGCSLLNGTSQTVPDQTLGFLFEGGINTFNMNIIPDSGEIFTLTGTSTLSEGGTVLDFDFDATSATGTSTISGTVDVDVNALASSGDVTITANGTDTVCALVNWSALSVTTLADFAAFCELDAPTCN